MEQSRGAMVECVCKNKSCQGKFMARVADRKRGWGKFCSKSCKAKHQERKTGQMKNYLIRQTYGYEGGGFANAHLFDNCEK